MGKTVLAIDYGLERVGLALASDGAPQRLQTLPNNEYLRKQLADIIADRNVDTVVVGLPRTSDGADTAWTEKVRLFAKELAGTVKVPIDLHDEFGTTSEANARLDSQNMSLQQQRAILDQEAAVVVLEDYLHGL